MHQPGPPRFCAVGESVELAPRDPDPERETSYEWSILESPAGSDDADGLRPTNRRRFQIML